MTTATKKTAAKKPVAKKTAKPATKATAKKTAKPATKATAKKAAATGKKPRGPGIGSLIKDLILKNKETEAILEAVLAKFPEAATTANNVSWYRTKLRADGLLK